MKAIYRVEFYFHADPDRPEADLGRLASERMMAAIGHDQGLHQIAEGCGMKACGRSWERNEVPGGQSA